MSESKPSPDDICDWLIEYEIPPLRAIYFAEAADCTEQEARDLVTAQESLWRIREITRKPK